VDFHAPLIGLILLLLMVSTMEVARGIMEKVLLRRQYNAMLLHAGSPFPRHPPRTRHEICLTTRRQMTGFIATSADPPPVNGVAAEMPHLPVALSPPVEAAHVKKPGIKSSPYRGVTLFRPTMKWRAQVRSQSVFTVGRITGGITCQSTYTLKSLPP
jgi:hypothetical protein